MVHFDGISIAILFGLIQAFILIYLFGVKKRFLQHRPFIWVILVIIIALVESLFIRSGLMIKFPHVLNIATPFILLLGPFSYDYVLSQIGIVSKLKSKLFPLLPFLFYFIYSFNFYLQSTQFKYNIYVSNFQQNLPKINAVQNFSSDPWEIQGWVVVELLSLHLLIYGVLSFYRIIKYFKQNPQANKERMYWLYYLAGISTLAAFVLFFSQGGIINGKIFFKSPFPNYSTDLFSTAIMYLFTIYILGKPDFFKLNAKKYGKSTLSQDFKKEKLKQLLHLIEVEKLFLNTNFSLNMLADKSGLSTHHISQILNEELNSSFFEISNHYRIIEAKFILETSKEYIKMEQLAYDLGYKSKSTFFKAFKKETNTTPLKYRETLSN